MLSIDAHGAVLLGDPAQARQHARLFGGFAIGLAALLALLVANLISFVLDIATTGAAADPIAMVVMLSIATICLALLLISCVIGWRTSHQRAAANEPWVALSASDVGLAIGAAAPIPWQAIERIEVTWYTTRRGAITVGAKIGRAATDALGRKYQLDNVRRGIAVVPYTGRTVRAAIGPYASDDEFRALLVELERRLRESGGVLVRDDQRFRDRRRW